MTAAEKRAAYIRELVDTAPRFSQSQIAALATILGPVLHGSPDALSGK